MLIPFYFKGTWQSGAQLLDGSFHLLLHDFVHRLFSSASPEIVPWKGPFPEIAQNVSHCFQIISRALF